MPALPPAPETGLSHLKELTDLGLAPAQGRPGRPGGTQEEETHSGGSHSLNPHWCPRKVPQLSSDGETSGGGTLENITPRPKVTGGPFNILWDQTDVDRHRVSDVLLDQLDMERDVTENECRTRTRCVEMSEHTNEDGST